MLLWHKYLESLGKSDVFTHVFFQYVMEDEHTKEPSHNNPEEAADYVKAVNLLLQSFVNDIRGFNRYKRQDAYKTFLHTLSQLLSKLDSAYFTNMDTEVVLDMIPDKVCAAFLAHPEEAADKVQQRVSSDSIPTGSEVTSKMCLQGNIPSFDKKGQQAITKLFGHLQDAHNHMSEVAKAVVDVSEVSSPEQFTFVLQLAVRPITQLKIPPHLSAPTELKFEKERLTPEEITEENCCNLILPRPFHPKFSTIAFKHPTRCLAVAAHFLIRKKLFNTKYPQLLVARDFAVAEKKLHLAVSGRKYDPGKKAPKKRRTSDVKTADPKPSTSQDQPQDKSVSEQQPHDKSISEQQPQDESVSEQQPQDESVSEQPQGTSASEQQPQGKASTSTLQEPIPSQFSNDDETLPDPDRFTIYQSYTRLNVSLLFSVPIRRSTKNISFFSSSHLLTPLTNCSCSSSVPVLIPFQ